MLCKKKGPSTPFSVLPFLPSFSLSLFSSWLLADPVPVTHRWKDHTVRSHSRHPFLTPSPVCGGLVEWSPPSPPAPPPPVTSVVDSQCCFLKWGERGVSIIVFFSDTRGGAVCESYFSSFRRNKAHVMLSCPPLSPSVSHISPLPSPPPSSLFVSVCVHCVNHCPC